MKPYTSTPAPPLRFGVHFAFENLFQTYIGLGCLFVSMPSGEGWKIVMVPRTWVRPWWFERFYGKVEVRDKAQAESFRRVAREKRAHADCIGNLWDVYSPVLQKGRVVGALISGSYARKDIQPTELRLRWKEITGHEGSDQNSDFLRFARTMLEAPVFDERTEEAFLHVMELMGRWIGGEADPAFIPEVERFHREVFAAALPHPQWVNWIMGMDKYDRRGTENNFIEPWVRHEMGLTRYPTVVAALMPRPDGARSGIVETMCRIKTFQRECFQAARWTKESVATTLGDYGSVVLTSTRPGLSAAQAKVEVRERIRQLSETIEKRIGVPVLSGIGSFSPGGVDLTRSYREAVTGLHLALEKGRSPIFIEATEGERATPPHEEVRSTMRTLADAYERGAAAKVGVIREMLIRQVMFASLGQVGPVRTYLTASLQMLLERFERKSGAGADEARAVGDEWSGRLMEATTPPDLVGVFRVAIENLVRYQSRPLEAGAAARIETVLRELSDAPGKAWSVEVLCRKTGMSPPTFLKWFKKVAGAAFGPYLRQLRLVKAQEMLMEGTLTVERVAQECGFSSASAFIAFFQKASGLSPGRFRAQAAKNGLMK